MDSLSQQYPRSRARGCSCLVLTICVLVLSGGLAWFSLPPVRDLFHNGAPITISVPNSSTLFINNDARNGSLLLKRDAAHIHIHAGASDNKVLIRATNIPIIGESLISYHQNADPALTFIDVNRNYRGSIDIEVPVHTNIHLDSYENGVDIDGLTGRFVLNSYQGSIHVSHSTLSGPSLLTSYQGSIVADTVILKYASSFKSYQGDITFQGVPAPEGDHFFYTYNGAITLMLPATSSFSVDAYTYTNLFTTDFSGLQAGNRTLQGTIGQSPRTHLHLFTYQNAIKIQRSKEV